MPAPTKTAKLSVEKLSVAHYKSRPASEQRVLPVTGGLSQRVPVLPAGSSVGPAEVSGVGELLRSSLEHAEAIRRKLDERASA